MIPIVINMQKAASTILKKIITRQEQPATGVGLSAAWDIEYLPYLEKVFEEIGREKANSKYYELFVGSMIDQYEDRRYQRNYAPRHVSVDMNSLTVDGITLCNQNITGEETTRFLWMMSGTGNTVKPTMYSQKLENENARIAIDQQGWFFARGTTLVQGTKFPTSLPTATIVEFGSSNVGDPSSPDHVLFWRNRITNSAQYVSHIQYKTVYLHVHVIDFRSVSE